ncbi:hypothetical protein ASG43_16075 [Aureimonas sp. Leaf454]|uniref:TadE/TadG family type IV pilus assembly protein n=1 Tax=Aureimonas sp. Leaf454 TaxID=1736381 RepID=UPI0006F6FC55|nr:TadE/TadG family type IV pilus assembly protein [Aureimonas sp. Leaf454]KQT43044.1 hypothetical protein ASG43_16075 [Aureimonas sp. Leaf454]
MARIGRFGRDRAGNFAVTAAIAAVPLVFVVGGVVDLSRAYGSKTRLQSAADAAALAVIKSSGFDADRAMTIADQMIEANYGSDFQNLQVSFDGDKATVAAETAVDTTLSAVLGYRRLSDEVSSTAEYPRTRYEIVLVLDTTGSMAGTKLAEMKKAAAEMIDELTATPELRERVRFAIVPFSSAVNVGPDKLDAAWIDSAGRNYLPNSAIPAKVNRLKVFGNLGTSWKGCVEARLEGTKVNERFATNDAAPTASKPETLFVPLLAPDEPGGYAYLNNYVNDDTLAGLGLDVATDAADVDTIAYNLVSNLTKVVGSLLSGGSRGGDPNRGCDSRPITPLSDDPDALKSEIGSLQAAGNTNITEGVAWGQRVLSPGAPFVEGADPKSDVRKIMVVLTDGDNVIGRASNPNGSGYSAYGYVADGRWNKSYLADKSKQKCTKVKDASSGKTKACQRALLASPPPSDATITSAMNAETAEACARAKDTSELYAIRLEVNSAASSKLLSQCATDADHYYDARSAADLKGIFDDITQRILRLRITS